MVTWFGSESCPCSAPRVLLPPNDSRLSISQMTGPQPGSHRRVARVGLVQQAISRPSCLDPQCKAVDAMHPGCSGPMAVAGHTPGARRPCGGSGRRSARVSIVLRWVVAVGRSDRRGPGTARGELSRSRRPPHLRGLPRSARQAVQIPALLRAHQHSSLADAPHRDLRTGPATAAMSRSSDAVRGRTPAAEWPEVPEPALGLPCCRLRTSPGQRMGNRESSERRGLPGAKVRPALRFPCPTTASGLTAAFNHAEKFLVPSRPTAKSRDGLV